MTPEIDRPDPPYPFRPRDHEGRQRFDHNGTAIEDGEDTTAGGRRRTYDYRASR
jgi:hypothetical protein